MEPIELERFEAVMLPHLDAAYGLARSMVRDDADAEDVVQEAFLRAVRHFGGFRGDVASQGRAWLLTIVRNMARTWMHRRKGDDTTEFDEAVHGVDGTGGTGGSDETDAEVIRGDARETVRVALERLPAELREVIVLREMEGLSYKEIADVADVPIGTVMSRLSRARKRLQQAMAGSDEER